MEKICKPGAWDMTHWRIVQADVATVAADLIPMVCANTVDVGTLRDSIQDFHECHVLALLHLLACQLHDIGQTPNAVRDQLLAWDVTDAMT